MYGPTPFAETDQAKLHDFIERHSFATVVSQDGKEPVASHLPLLLDREAEPHGRLIGHMARGNPQRTHLDGQNILAIFHGPHAYISPTWYEATNVVPTWNYVAVHVYGAFRLDDSRTRRLEIVRRYVEFYEESLQSRWSLDLADDGFIDKLLDAIVGLSAQRRRHQNHASC